WKLHHSGSGSDEGSSLKPESGLSDVSYITQGSASGVGSYHTPESESGGVAYPTQEVDQVLEVPTLGRVARVWEVTSLGEWNRCCSLQHSKSRSGVGSLCALAKD